MVPEKKPKQQKITKDKGRASLVDNREVEHVVNMRHPTWNPRLELDGAAVP